MSLVSRSRARSRVASPSVPPPVGLTDTQLRAVMSSAGGLPAAMRARFLERFVVELRRQPRRDDQAVVDAADRSVRALLAQPAA